MLDSELKIKEMTICLAFGTNWRMTNCLEMRFDYYYYYLLFIIE